MEPNGIAKIDNIDSIDSISYNNVLLQMLILLEGPNKEYI